MTGERVPLARRSVNVVTVSGNSCSRAPDTKIGFPEGFFAKSVRGGKEVPIPVPDTMVWYFSVTGGRTRSNAPK